MALTEMTSKERILAPMRGLPTDRVPFQLGITNMFSVLLKGYTGWDIYLDEKEPLWKMVADITRQLGLDGVSLFRRDSGTGSGRAVSA